MHHVALLLHHATVQYTAALLLYGIRYSVFGILSNSYGSNSYCNTVYGSTVYTVHCTVQHTYICSV